MTTLISRRTVLAAGAGAAAGLWVPGASAQAVGDGRTADPCSSQRSPRTPTGPSDSTIDRSPASGSARVVQKLSPVSKRTRRAASSDATRRSTRFDRDAPVGVSQGFPIGATFPQSMTSRQRCGRLDDRRQEQRVRGA